MVSFSVESYLQEAQSYVSNLEAQAESWIGDSTVDADSRIEGLLGDANSRIVPESADSAFSQDVAANLDSDVFSSSEMLANLGSPSSFIHTIAARLQAREAEYSLAAEAEYSQSYNSNLSELGEVRQEVDSGLLAADSSIMKVDNNLLAY